MIINWYTGIRIDQQLCNNYARTIVELYIFHINCYEIELRYRILACCCFIKRTVLLFIINIGLLILGLPR